MPRLFDRSTAASYLGLSATQFDNLRHAGEIRPVPVPSDRSPSGVSSRPLFDKADLDAAVERWKAGTHGA